MEKIQITDMMGHYSNTLDLLMEEVQTCKTKVEKIHSITKENWMGPSAESFINKLDQYMILHKEVNESIEQMKRDLSDILLTTDTLTDV